MSNRFKRSISSIAAAALLATSVPAPAYANKASAAASLAVRERVETLLVNRGVQLAEARARAAALTDEEASRVAAEMDALPAGAGVAGLMALVVLAYVTLMVAAKAFEEELRRTRRAAQSIRQASPAVACANCL